MKGSPQTMKRRGRRILFVILALIGFILGWYGIVRLLSPWNVVKVLTVDTSQTRKSFPDVADELRVGCYNVASGRGGSFGAMNWEGGDRHTKIARVKDMARLVQQANLDIVVLNEVDFSSFWSGHVDHARIFAQEAGYPYLVEQRNVDAGIPLLRVQFGNAVLSGIPSSTPPLSHFPIPPCGILLAVIRSMELSVRSSCQMASNSVSSLSI